MKVSEIFGPTIQGEGYHMGVPSVFIRLVGCSLRCQGFGQEDPTGEVIPWDDPLEKIDTKKITMIEDVPKEVYTKTCDSNWAWHPKFKHLFREFTAEEIVSEINKLAPNILQQIECGNVHLVISGGEPLLPLNQKNIVSILNALSKQIDTKSIELTFETNGIQKIGKDLDELLDDMKINVTMSISPKLYTVAGERNDKAIKPDIVAQLVSRNNKVSYLKFVIGNEPRQEEELERILKLMPGNIITYLMPVGKDSEDVVKVRRHVAEIATKRYLRFSDRLHAHIWDNEMGR